ncbi:MAG: AraC family transcriptional regulator [Spirochaetales bacterium]|nr:AraC family transcriptional regulator [Spirochaetales bacterium]
MTVPISELTQLVRYLMHLKADIPGIFRAAGADPDVLNRPDGRVPVAHFVAVEEEAARVAGDPHFGLHLGEFFDPGHWSILGYMMMNCRTLEEAFEKAARYQKICGYVIGARYQLGLGTVTCVLSVPKHAPPLSRHCYEGVFSSTVRMVRTLTGRNLRPKAVGFSHPLSAPKAEYERIFGCPVLFSQKRTYMTVPMEIAGWPVLLPDRRLLAQFESYARAYLSELEGRKKTTDAVVRILLESLDARNLKLKTVAKEMGLSGRVLQVRLRNEGTVFRKLLEETRERLAKKYLAEKYTVEDITYLLGFSEASVFRKAFKKWSGQTPCEYRKSAVGA